MMLLFTNFEFVAYLYGPQFIHSKYHNEEIVSLFFEIAWIHRSPLCKNMIIKIPLGWKLHSTCMGVNIMCSIPHEYLDI